VINNGLPELSVLVRHLAGTETTPTSRTSGIASPIRWANGTQCVCTCCSRHLLATASRGKARSIVCTHTITVTRVVRLRTLSPWAHFVWNACLHVCMHACLYHAMVSLGREMQMLSGLPGLGRAGEIRTSRAARRMHRHNLLLTRKAAAPPAPGSGW
jgi:hypothetical protein